MDSTVEVTGDVAPRVREWPAWGVPAHAVEEWVELQGRLLAAGLRVPCRGRDRSWWMAETAESAGGSAAAGTRDRRSPHDDLGRGRKLDSRAGAVTTWTLHRLEHTDEEVAAIFTGTRHPLGQMQACWCDSGEPCRDCHLRDRWAEPCGCRSGETFQDCCLVAPVEAVTPVATKTR